MKGLSTLEHCQISLLIARPDWERIKDSVDVGHTPYSTFLRSRLPRHRFLAAIAHMEQCGLLTQQELSALRAYDRVA